MSLLPTDFVLGISVTQFTDIRVAVKKSYNKPLIARLFQKKTIVRSEISEHLEVSVKSLYVRLLSCLC